MYMYQYIKLAFCLLGELELLVHVIGWVFIVGTTGLLQVACCSLVELLVHVISWVSMYASTQIHDRTTIYSLHPHTTHFTSAVEETMREMGAICD